MPVKLTGPRCAGYVCPLYCLLQMSAMAARDVLKQLDGMFVFGLVWSVGATTDSDGRTRFSDFLRKLLDGQVGHQLLACYAVLVPQPVRVSVCASARGPWYYTRAHVRCSS